MLRGGSRWRCPPWQSNRVYHLPLFCHVLFAQSLDCVCTHCLTPVVLFGLILNMSYSLITLEECGSVVIVVTFRCLATALGDRLKFSTNLFTLPLKMLTVALSQRARIALPCSWQHSRTSVHSALWAKARQMEGPTKHWFEAASSNCFFLKKFLFIYLFFCVVACKSTHS